MSSNLINTQSHYQRILPTFFTVIKCQIDKLRDPIYHGSIIYEERIEWTMSFEIPFWEKYTLSIEEAAAYFRIGENKLRKIVSENPDADFILWNNTRAQIKRKKFEDYIDSINVI